MVRFLDQILAINAIEDDLIDSLDRVSLEELHHQYDNEEYTSLHIASMLGMSKLVQAMMLHDYKLRQAPTNWRSTIITSRDSTSRNLMHYALLASSEEVSIEKKLKTIEVLHYADPMLIHDVDSDGKTPLFYASKIGCMPLVAALIQYGSIASKRAHDESTPSQVALTNNHKEVSVFLRDRELSLMERCLKVIMKNESQRQAVLKFYPEHLQSNMLQLDQHPRILFYCLEEKKKQSKIETIEFKMKHLTI